MSSDFSEEIDKLRQLEASLEGSGSGKNDGLAPVTPVSQGLSDNAEQTADQGQHNFEPPDQALKSPQEVEMEPVQSPVHTLPSGIPVELLPDEHPFEELSSVELSTGADRPSLIETPVASEELRMSIGAEEPDAVLSASEDDSKVMTVIEHLGELRTRIIRCLLMFLVAFGLAFTFGKEIILFLEVPAANCKMSFQVLSVEEPLMVTCKVSFYAALMLVAPYLIAEASMFVAPGLRRSERRILSPIIFGGPLLFLLGGLFCYYLVLPPMLSFFSSFGVGIAPVQQRLDFYVSLVTTMLFYMGICFQLPVVLFALSLAGIVNSGMLIRFWRYALVGASIAAAIITPDPTIFSMLIVLAGLIGLYFATIVLLKVFGR